MRRGGVFTLPARLLENDLPEVCFEFLLRKERPMLCTPPSHNSPYIPTLFCMHNLTPTHLIQHDCLCADFNKGLFPAYLSICSANFLENLLCVRHCGQNQGYSHA